MKETRFIQQNKDKWSKDEAILKNKNAHPDDISEAFTEITEDLSFAKTFYSYRTVRLYLNNQAQRIYFRINKKKFNGSKMIAFWTNEIPKAMVESRKDMNLAFLIFLFGLALGVFSSVYDPDFARVILGEDYIDLTLRNIEKGDPMGIYKQSNQFDMFFKITLNNLMVAYRVFIMGILFSIGSAIILFYNAIMVGTFQFFFFENAVFKESILAIWLHGTFEISAIILAAGAGLTLGRGLLFPGSLSRSQAFQLSAQRGLKIMLGITPVFILAAIIESFATRYTEAPDIYRILIILSSLSFILFYYVWYPWKKEQEGFEEDNSDLFLSQTLSEKIDLEQIKSIGKVFSDTFLFMRKVGAKAYLIIGIASLIISAYFIYINRNNDLLPLVGGDWFVYNLSRYFLFYSVNVGYLLNFILLSGILISFAYFFRRTSSLSKSISLSQKIALPIVIFAWHFLFLFEGVKAWFLILAFTPLAFLIIAGILECNASLDLNRIIKLVFTRIIRSYMLTILIVLVSFILFVLAYSPLLWFYMEFFHSNLDVSDSAYTNSVVFTLTFILTYVFFTSLAFLFSGLTIMYYSNKELVYAQGLEKELSSIKIKKMAYGLESE